MKGDFIRCYNAIIRTTITTPKMSIIILTTCSQHLLCAPSILQRLTHLIYPTRVST